MEEIKSFWKQFTKEENVLCFYKQNDLYGFCSNCHIGNFNYILPDIGIKDYETYKNKIFIMDCGERAIHYTKAILFNDIETANKILKVKSPMYIKKLGRQVSNFNNTIWNNNVCKICEHVLRYKFMVSEYKELLLNTKEFNIIAETTPNDKLWANGMSLKNVKRFIPAEWNGLNILGYYLLKLRNELLNKT